MGTVASGSVASGAVAAGAALGMAAAAAWAVSVPRPLEEDWPGAIAAGGALGMAGVVHPSAVGGGSAGRTTWSHSVNASGRIAAVLPSLALPVGCCRSSRSHSWL